MSSNTHDRVAHNWAHQTGKACNGHHMFYRGDTIYSYGHHFPIARLLPPPDVWGNDCPVVLFTSEGYSVSTAKHKTIVRRAIPPHWQVIDVPDIGAPDHCTIDGTVADVNRRKMLAEADKLVRKAARARVYGQYHLEAARRLVADVNAYARLFHLDWPEATLDGLAADMADIHRRAEEQAERERQRREERDRAYLLSRIQAERERHPELSAWLRGEPEAHRPHTARPWCRVNGDKVETTWGAEVPLPVAIRAFKLATARRRHKAEAEAGGLQEGQHVGAFRLDRVSPSGTLHIGCHAIPWRIAKVAADLAGISLEEPCSHTLS